MEPVSQGVRTDEIVEALEDDSEQIIIRNEFASVSIKFRDTGGRPRLLIEDLRTRQRVELDAIELESLAWARHQDLWPLLDPSLTRWANRDA